VAGIAAPGIQSLLVVEETGGAHLSPDPSPVLGRGAKTGGIAGRLRRRRNPSLPCLPHPRPLRSSSPPQHRGGAGGEVRSPPFPQQPTGSESPGLHKKRSLNGDLLSTEHPYSVQPRGSRPRRGWARGVVEILCARSVPCRCVVHERGVGVGECKGGGTGGRHWPPDARPPCRRCARAALALAVSEKGIPGTPQAGARGQRYPEPFTPRELEPPAGARPHRAPSCTPLNTPTKSDPRLKTRRGPCGYRRRSGAHRRSPVRCSRPWRRR
jgi:hypothetical protein